VDKRFLVGGIVAAAACAALVRAGHPAPVVDAPPAAMLALTSPESPLPARSPAPRPSAPPPVVVYVAGEVRRPGVYRLAPSARVDDAVRAAGGAGPAADPVAVNLAERLRDGEEIVVPARGAAPLAVAPAGDSAPTSPRRRRRRTAVARSGSRAEAPASHRRSGRRTHKAPPETPVDVNTADETTLETIPGIGPRLAARIVEFRETNGPYAAPDDLLDVNGVSERLLDEIAPYLSFAAR
jgi:competence protein ComEA